MIKHKKILKNFNFKIMVEGAIEKSPELRERLTRFDIWKSFMKSRLGKIEWSKKNYCFEYMDNYFLEKYSGTTSAKKFFIGHYLHKGFKDYF